MGALGNVLPSVIKPGWGGYTYPRHNPVQFLIAPRQNPFFSTHGEAAALQALILKQGDLIPEGQELFIRQQLRNEVGIDFDPLGSMVPLVLEFAGPKPLDGGKDVPTGNSEVQLTDKFPYLYACNVGVLLVSAPKIPGATGNFDWIPSCIRDDFKISIVNSNLWMWAGLDVPSVQAWQTNIPKPVVATQPIAPKTPTFGS